MGAEGFCPLTSFQILVCQGLELPRSELWPRACLTLLSDRRHAPKQKRKGCSNGYDFHVGRSQSRRSRISSESALLCPFRQAQSRRRGAVNGCVSKSLANAARRRLDGRRVNVFGLFERALRGRRWAGRVARRLPLPLRDGQLRGSGGLKRVRGVLGRAEAAARERREANRSRAPQRAKAETLPWRWTRL